MASGVVVNEDCQNLFEEMKIRHSFKYLIFKISKDQKEIVVDEKGPPDATYEDLIEKLKMAEDEKQGRYCVFDFPYDDRDPKKTKLVFIMWIPENIPIKQKMLYTSSKKGLMPKLQGVAKEIQGNDDDDIAWSNLAEKCQPKFT